MIPEDVSLITEETYLRSLHPAMMSRAKDKELSKLDEHCRNIISRAPFCVIGTQGPDGGDVSPRGDPPGFVKVLDDEHVLVPDRIGNNRFDTMKNLLVNKQIAILFFIPGMEETLRIRGLGSITDDARLLEGMEVRGQPPKIGILIQVQNAFLHCPKAFIRSKLWHPESQIDRSELPSFTDMLMDHVAGLTPEENERQGKVMAKRGLY